MDKTIVIRELVSKDPINYRSGTYTSAIENGMLVNLSGLSGSNHDLWTATIPTDKLDLWVVASPELMYEEVPRKYLWDYENAANEAFRCDRVRTGVILGISSVGFTMATEATDFVKGASVVFVSGSIKMSMKAKAVTGDIVIGKVIEVSSRSGRKIASILFNDPIIV